MQTFQSAEGFVIDVQDNAPPCGLNLKGMTGVNRVMPLHLYGGRSLPRFSQAGVLAPPRREMEAELMAGPR